MTQLAFEAGVLKGDPDYWYGVDQFIAPDNYETGVDAVVDAASPEIVRTRTNSQEFVGVLSAMRRAVRIGLGRTQTGILPYPEDYAILSRDLLKTWAPEFRDSMFVCGLVSACIDGGVAWAESHEYLPAEHIEPGIQQGQLEIPIGAMKWL